MALVLQLNEHGVPIQWATWQDVVRYKCLDMIVWEMGEFDWTKYGGTNRMSGQRTEVKVSSIVAVRTDHFPKRLTPALTNPNLFARDLNICAYCGGKFDYRHLTNDHIKPRSRGGVHSWTNCVTACKRCNNHKDSKTLEEARMELLYIPYVPSAEEALILRNRSILADQMEFLNPMLPDHSRLKIKS